MGEERDEASSVCWICGNRMHDDECACPICGNVIRKKEEDKS